MMIILIFYLQHAYIHQRKNSFDLSVVSQNFEGLFFKLGEDNLFHFDLVFYHLLLLLFELLLFGFDFDRRLILLMGCLLHYLLTQHTAELLF